MTTTVKTAPDKSAGYAFLQEILCDVGKQAIGVAITEINCTKKSDYYSLQILDNGIGLASSLI